MHRAISPLKQADDAVLVDTSDMNIEQVVAALGKIIDEKEGGQIIERSNTCKVSRLLFWCSEGNGYCVC